MFTVLPLATDYEDGFVFERRDKPFEGRVSLNDLFKSDLNRSDESVSQFRAKDPKGHLSMNRSYWVVELLLQLFDARRLRHAASTGI